ncbi:YfgM family protein [Luteibaculum oceani]|uniref:Tetratricopeptide repeat protein n=1 Tax=Luteibaculum oceani TaxID=1294296 RepID=A0A5C6US66_9FLAO|nr:tetratricopeptide repeat protein [Luteibaculum oceani]TXC76172.1 tetratricopeptide repeat protein [Luteibaculum oceani]
MSDNKPEEKIVDVDKVYSQSEDFFEKNKKQITLVGGVLVAILGIFLAYKNLYQKPRIEEAKELMWKAEYYFEIDSLDKAIQGDGTNFGFEYIASEYSGTPSGNLAHYYLGISYLKKSQFEMAIDHLKAADLDDKIVGAIAKGGIGDAYVELGVFDKALDYYSKAISHSDNSFSAPLYLMKKATLLEEMGQFDKALKAYEQIKSKYPESAEAQDIDKYIARASSFAG